MLQDSSVEPNNTLMASMSQYLRTKVTEAIASLMYQEQIGFLEMCVTVKKIKLSRNRPWRPIRL
jgi:hypothetical protein